MADEEDVGGFLSIHAPGAYFGLAVAWMLGEPEDQTNAEGATVVSDLLGMLGSVVLFVYWPSCVYGGATDYPGHTSRCITNVYLSLFGSVLRTFILSGL